MARWFCLLFFCLNSLFVLAQSDVRPFVSHNQSPLIHSFGLPHAESGLVTAKNKFQLISTVNLASNSTNAQTPNEIVYFDGEMFRLDFDLRYGLSENIEIGLNIPVVKHSCGFMDSSIDGFHSFLGLSGGARAGVPQDEIWYAYIQDDNSYFNIYEDSFGVGDVSLRLAYQLVKGKRHSLAFRTNLKFNTGKKENLIGSGTFDFSFQLSGQTKGIGERPAYFFYSLGYLNIGNGSLLEDFQTHNVVFGSLGLAVRANKWFAPKMQFDYHSRIYKNSTTQELSGYGLQFLLGSDFILSKKLILTAGFSEDVKINNSPDFVFHMGMNFTF